MFDKYPFTDKRETQRNIHDIAERLRARIHTATLTAAQHTLTPASGMMYIITEATLSNDTNAAEARSATTDGTNIFIGGTTVAAAANVPADGLAAWNPPVFVVHPHTFAIEDASWAALEKTTAYIRYYEVIL